ncbi:MULTISPECIES: helix-turn-helix transcriptional regulator [unclassified Sphingomonas]|uniref:helix-turn-helix transcriptional regulator n=1 Tax=unclassified Sphingomonas TaxID=196159 RepID=UPI0006FC5C16|nr:MULTISPECIES: LuxR C-terminal-related transcriptional regulator [unclassified Sphingomonas]KQX18579.1 hypothetical protein ASD17_15660 [Sphingomonas sp. Root1294]KQY72097.1 hypothetical protein ASD39_19315 [Sphingomonas sp. Root50]KRB94633.1 hypothetical protein ASE22_01440 [Sphingomonas sp. Root720]
MQNEQLIGARAPLIDCDHVLTDMPRLRTGFMLRERFKLPDPYPAGFTGILAPTGFGKTQLLAYWFYELRSRDVDTLWLSGKDLDGRDMARPFRFRMEASKAAQRAVFIDALDDACSPDLLAPLIERGVAIFVAGSEALRSSLPFTRIIDPEELRFDRAEAAFFVRQRAGGTTCSPNDLDRCAGIPALLNIAVADMGRLPRKLSLARGEQGLASEWLMAALARLTQEERDFLSSIALFDAVSPQLANHISERRDGSRRLARLAIRTPLFMRSGRNAFALIPIARDHLNGLSPNTVRRNRTHRFTARWFAEHGAYAEAIHHALAGGDQAFALSLMEPHLLELVAAGELERALDWISSIPRDQLIASQDLCLAVALTHLIAKNLERARWVLAHLTADHRLIVRALYASRRDHYDEVETLLAAVSAPERLTKIAAACYANMRRCADSKRGLWTSARSTMPASPVRSDDAPLRLTRSVAVFLDAERLLTVGRADDAVAAIEPLVEECEARLGGAASLTALASSMLAAAYLQAGKVDQAATLLVERLDAMAGHSIPGVIYTSLLTAARLAALQSNYTKCLDHLDRLEMIALEQDFPRLRALALAERVRVYALGRQQMLASFTFGTLEKVQLEIARDMPIDAARIDLEVLLARAHLLSSLDKQEELAAVLDQAAAAAQQLRRTMDLAEIEALRTARAGGPQDAPSGKGWRIGTADWRSLMARLGIERLPLGSLRTDAAEDTGIEVLEKPVMVKLTSREQRVLEGLSNDLSNKAIARDLKLSSETVKWYVSRLFDKLGANDRRHAVNRANALGLLRLSFSRAPRDAGGGELTALRAARIGR